MEVAVLEAEADPHEHEVQEEHGEAEASVHLPPEAGDADDDKDEHSKQQHDAADHALGIDSHRLPVDEPVQEPWERQPGTEKITILPT